MGDVQVDAVVDVRATVDQLTPHPERLGKGLAGQLRGEIEIGRDAAGSRRRGPAGEVILGPGGSGVEQ